MNVQVEVKRTLVLHHIQIHLEIRTTNYSLLNQNVNHTMPPVVITLAGTMNKSIYVQKATCVGAFMLCQFNVNPGNTLHKKDLTFVKNVIWVIIALKLISLHNCVLLEHIMISNLR